MHKQGLRKVIAVIAVVALLSVAAPVCAEARALVPDIGGEISYLVEDSMARAWSFFGGLWVTLTDFWAKQGASIEGGG